MTYTPEQKQQNIAAFIAFMDGKPVEYYTEGEWRGTDNVNTHWLHRPKPEPKTRQWNCPNDVPFGCWIRHINKPDDGSMWMVTVICRNGVHINATARVGMIDWQELNTRFEYSTDLRTWAPCEVKE